MESLILFAIITGIVVTIVVVHIHMTKKRTELLKNTASSMGFTFIGDEPNLHVNNSTFKLFSRGHSKKTKNVIKGEVSGVSVKVADYHYTTGHGRNSSHHSQTICMITDPSLSIPHFFLRRENKFLDSLGKIFGGQDINFDEDPDFSKSFVLQGKDEFITREFFNRNLRASMMKFAHDTMHIEGYENTVILHNKTTLKPDGLNNLMEKTLEVYQMLKSSGN